MLWEWRNLEYVYINIEKATDIHELDYTNISVGKIYYQMEG